METIRELRAFLREANERALQRTRQRTLALQIAKGLPTTDEKANNVPLLNNYDATAEEVDNTLKNDETPGIRMPSRRLQIWLWIYVFGYSAFIFTISFYGFGFLANQTTVLTEKVAGTISRTYSTMAATYADMKNPGSTKEVASLMEEFYILLSEMGYYEPEAIDRAPHTNQSINGTYAKELGFSDKAVEMMEKLPYLKNEHDFWWLHGAGDADYLPYGRFIDFRVDESLQFCKDTMHMMHELDWQGDEVEGFNEDRGPYMTSDYLCLSIRDDPFTAMILNVKKFKLWMFDMDIGNSYLALSDDDNHNSPYNRPSRPANLALKAYMQKFKDLEWLPGGFDNGTWEGDNCARLYRENGWPSSFNRTAFKIAREKWTEDESARWDSEQPFQEVAKYEGWLKSTLHTIENKQNAIADVDAWKEIPNDQADRPDRFADRARYRQELVDDVKSNIGYLPKLHEELEEAREALKRMDPALWKAREDRIAKYGW